MVQEVINKILYQYSYFNLYLLGFLYFLFLYFALAPSFLAICSWLTKKNILNKIVDKEIPAKQIRYEKMHSFGSIIIFGFSSLPIFYLIRVDFITLLPNSIMNVLLGVIILTIWNEIHFFIVHRIMHLSFFMRNVHVVHHRSNIPTVYSVYSFHWFEALLLSTVPLTIVPFLPFSPVAIFLYPLASVLFNYAGHCNYRFGNGTGKSWKLFGTNHNDHHFKAKKNYGFVSNMIDKLYTFILRSGDKHLH